MAGNIYQVLSVLCAAVFLDNTILSKALGTSTLLTMAKNKSQLLPFGICMTAMSTISCSLAYFADKFLLNLDFSYLYMPVIYVMIIAVVYVVTLLILWKFANKFFIKAKKFIHLCAFNCAIVGGLFVAPGRNLVKGVAPLIPSGGFLSYFLFGFGTGIGFLMVSGLLFAVYGRLYSHDMPEMFRGYPLVMMYLGFLSLVFLGLSTAI